MASSWLPMSSSFKKVRNLVGLYQASMKESLSSCSVRHRSQQAESVPQRRETQPTFNRSDVRHTVDTITYTANTDAMGRKALPLWNPAPMG